jgi:hypothetical protein
VPPTARVAETEKSFQGWVIEFAQWHHWEVFHPWTSIHSPQGWPDLALVRPPRFVVAELKSQKGKLRPAQARWLDKLERCPGVEVFVWRPSDRDEIGIVLGLDDQLGASVRRHPARPS